MTNRTASGEGSRVTKAQRKEEARLKRLEIQARTARRRRMRVISLGVIVVVAVAVVAFVATRPKSDKNPTASGALPGMLTGSQPWPNNTTDLAARLAMLKLPAAGSVMHIHAHLDIFVNGTQVPVPAEIGMSSSAESPVHTHDVSGVIHMESASQTTFTLAELFDVWGVRFTSTCIGGSCNTGDQTLRLFVNGEPYAGDPRALVLNDHDEVVVAYGTRAQLPSPIPATFDWANASL